MKKGNKISKPTFRFKALLFRITSHFLPTSVLKRKLFKASKKWYKLERKIDKLNRKDRKNDENKNSYKIWNECIKEMNYLAEVHNVSLSILRKRKDTYIK